MNSLEIHLGSWDSHRNKGGSHYLRGFHSRNPCRYRTLHIFKLTDLGHPTFRTWQNPSKSAATATEAVNMQRLTTNTVWTVTGMRGLQVFTHSPLCPQWQHFLKTSGGAVLPHLPPPHCMSRVSTQGRFMPGSHLPSSRSNREKIYIYEFLICSVLVTF